ncbi:hypothetical protein INT48_002551 [Thamnidium elegans]|uniref:Tetratricopeptide repeat protein 39B n=1 Tax=Thamnidium elegans TaxID=101142 RepID=A0A8H7SVT3_9FUNG|nr:hypothetical protein INT48_002551 [Thamnidium elegans]
MFRHLSKLALKYTTNYHSTTLILVESWLKDMQIGLDALLDDQIMVAEDIFSCNLSEKSPFHAFGYALLLYTKAMLAMERTVIDQAIQCVLDVQVTLKRTMAKKTKTAVPTGPCIHTSYSAPLNLPMYHAKLVSQDAIELQFELLEANCILMSATLQFLKDNWFDHLKAAYDLRKAYKIYERLFEMATGVTIAKYETRKKRTASYHEYADYSLLNDTIEHGAYFGIGLFSVIFSVLPNKVGKILNTLGFHASRSRAILFLEKSCHSQTMYSSLSALVLLAYYTNISIYISPKLNQSFLFKDAQSMLEKMKKSYPHGQIWYLMEGKLKKLQGQLDTSIMLLKQAKSPAIPINRTDTQEYLRNASITEFTQFKSFLTYELGWSYIYAGNYFEASETFFCLESMCNWSRVFYHYISTCCMIADGRYDKAALEIRQMTNMLGQRKPNCNEQYAESRIKHWVDTSTKNQTTLNKTLQFDIVNPLWELVYLWNGTRLLSSQIVELIKQQPQTDPMICLLMGVIERDIEQNMELAMECFNLVLILTEETNSWIMPYAMYEIATTHCILFREKGHSEYKLIILDWINCIENYYSQNTQDNEWEARMQLRCQLLIESYK